MSLRLVTLAIRFVFIIVLAKFLPVADVGIYGYLTALVGYFIYIAGFEYYTFANRELIKYQGLKKNKKNNIIFNQLVVYFSGYIILIPTFTSILFYANFDVVTISIVVGISILEHLCQEWNRILISIEKVTAATFVLFFRGGAWGISTALLMLYFPGMRALDVIFFSWALSLVIAVLICFYSTPRCLLSSEIDGKLIFRGLQACFTLFLASVATRGIVTFDRVVIESISTKDILAAYSVYSSIGNAIVAAVDAAIVSFMFPRIVSAAQSGNIDTLKKQLAIFTKGCIGVALVVSLIIILSMDAMLSWYSNDSYSIYKSFLYYFIFFSVINIFSLPYHIALYSMNRDDCIMKSTLCGFGVYLSIILYTIFVCQTVSYVFIALIFSAIVTLVFKYFYYRVELKRWEEVPHG